MKADDEAFFTEADFKQSGGDPFINSQTAAMRANAKLEIKLQASPTMNCFKRNELGDVWMADQEGLIKKPYVSEHYTRKAKLWLLPVAPPPIVKCEHKIAWQRLGPDGVLRSECSECGRSLQAKWTEI